MSNLSSDENIAYHAARLLLLIARCGKPQGTKENKLPGIAGRTLLAKLDFFLRYPAYLRRAGIILGKLVSNADLGLATAEDKSVESHMVRYLYGPWDHIYYTTLAYMIGKDLIVVEGIAGVETFRLQPLGRDINNRLALHPAYADLARRADTTYKLFHSYSGSGLKAFIYNNFPEVVNREIGTSI